MKMWDTNTREYSSWEFMVMAYYEPFIVRAQLFKAGLR